MIRAALDHVIDLLFDVGIDATSDARNLQAPGVFVTVASIDDFTLGLQARVRGDIIAVVRDLGGDADIDHLDAIIRTIVPAIAADPEMHIDTIDTNEQATPPSGGKLPAIRVTYTLYLELKEIDNGD